MIRSFKFALLAMTLGLLPVVPLVQAEPLVWGVVPLPGAFNVHNGQVTGGILFDSMRLLEAQLPELQMRYKVLPMSRIKQHMDALDNLCSNGHLQSAERDRVGYFVPLMLFTPIHVLVRRQTLDQLLIEDGKVSLDWLFGRTYLRGALAKSRVYPEEIRERLHQAQVEGRIQALGGSMAGENLLLMVSHGRLDYVFDYPLIYTEVARHFSLSEPLVSVPLRESPHLVQVGIYCPRNAWGARMAMHLDHAIREISAQPETLLALYRRWLPPQVYGHYREELLRFFQQRAAASALVLD
ncbi:MAG TPA: hypothetical protein VLG17_10455 [Pseudomonas sp.]|uniref:hypothetical protein n=1 Tax=Pseudomonas sp. TaxID=306 RepID=UPI002CA7956E|nr:hypothetical protein [Pseudomonas sp.]HSX88410.1 hypothetical protein [Pseudomonas sp.]